MHRFVGTWSLVRWSSGEAQPFGPEPRGTLVYTAEGAMISAFMRRGRAPLAASLQELSAWRWRSSPSPDIDRRFIEAALGFNSYAGRYCIEGKRVHHDVEVALFPDWVGQRMTRNFRFEGDELALGFGNDLLVWRRGEA